MKDIEVTVWAQEKSKPKLLGDYTMGEVERAVNQSCLEPFRAAVELLTQERADNVPLVCPKCHAKLNVVGHKRERCVESVFGTVRISRSYGLCPNCQEYFFPADTALGLHDRATASPRVQEICALAALRAPVGQAEEDIRRMSGLKLSASTIHREARRQGEIALEMREADEQLASSLQGAAELSARAPKLPNHTTMVIEIDAWNIRERDNWGKTEKMLRAGADTGRWHWVYTGTVFRLDDRWVTDSDRPIITERGYVATRAGVESFQRQLYAEALQRGVADAQKVLILADGAVWIWNMAKDRFAGAKQRVDLHHVKEHLWGLAHALHGSRTSEAKEWVTPYLRWLEKRKDGVLDVISSLEQLSSKMGGLSEEQCEALRKELGYLNTHKNRMDYKEGKKLGEPIGSGAIESTCSQYQRRFKLTGQFWTLEGDEAFLALATLHRNGRWWKLFPHDLR